MTDLNRTARTSLENRSNLTKRYSLFLGVVKNSFKMSCDKLLWGEGGEDFRRLIGSTRVDAVPDTRDAITYRRVVVNGYG